MSVINRSDSFARIANSTENCSICDKTTAGKSLVGHINHVFHRSCIAQWFEQKSTCPLCRAQITNSREFIRLDSRSISRRGAAAIQAIRDREYGHLQELLAQGGGISREDKGRAITVAMKNGDFHIVALLEVLLSQAEQHERRDSHRIAQRAITLANRRGIVE